MQQTIPLERFSLDPDGDLALSEEDVIESPVPQEFTPELLAVFGKAYGGKPDED